MSCMPYLDEEDEVFEGGVEMGLLLELHDRVKVLVVDVGVHPEQTLQNGLRHRHEVTLEGDALSQQKKYHGGEKQFCEGLLLRGKHVWLMLCNTRRVIAQHRQRGGYVVAMSLHCYARI